MALISTINQVLAETSGICDSYQEHLVGLYLDARLHLVHKQTISIGSLNQNLITAREVFIPALQYPSHTLILVHNHPSGNVNPSKNDQDVTQKIAAAGRILGIQLLDHVIVAPDKYYSFRAAGFLDKI